MADVSGQESLWPAALRRYDFTLSSPVENLALDESILQHVDAQPDALSVPGFLRFWQPTSYFVVLGRSNNVVTEVDIEYCQSAGIPILRRASGGGAVLVGPGCLCYALVLPLNASLKALGVSAVTSALMERTATGLRTQHPETDVRGTSDLVWRGLKFSGNAQRWLRRAFIHHGTLLYDFDIKLLERCLRHPSREPDYRQSRRHPDFVGNLPSSLNGLKDCLSDVWHASAGPVPDEIAADVPRIVDARLRQADWVITPLM